SLSANLSNVALERDDIVGDRDPLDVCVLTEKVITHGDILVKAKPIGGLRMIDFNQADDKIICVLNNDAFYGEIEDISELPPLVVERLRHYFLTYKDLPTGEKRNVEIPQIYGAEEAKKVIMASIEDYNNRYDNFEAMFNI
ncbi:MAG: inorganic diphosphatase, partial [Rikenellaceae bacterium]